jgi:hypothetical protein
MEHAAAFACQGGRATPAPLTWTSVWTKNVPETVIAETERTSLLARAWTAGPGVCAIERSRNARMRHVEATGSALMVCLAPHAIVMLDGSEMRARHRGSKVNAL